MTTEGGLGSGLGIAGFLKHTGDSGGGGQWLKRWRKGSVGEVTVWLHTRAPIVPSFSHTFMLEDEYEDKETKRMTPTLRYPRFISPDAEVVHRNQYFRNDDQTLQVPPDKDPFLLLREWLRFAHEIALDQPIFKWNDEKNRKLIVWDRGELSGLVKRGKQNFAHSIDTKLEYIYVLVDNDDIDGGPVLAREGKLLSQKIVEVINHQRKTWGDDEGDPMQHPYAFQLIAEDASSPMNAYKAFKNEKAAFTDAVWAQISSDEFPDPLPYGRPADGDMEKIRDAFEKAAQVDLPLDDIFSEDPAVRRALTRSRPALGQPARASKAAEAKRAQPPVPSRATATAPTPATTAPAAPAAAKSAGPQTRVRKKAAPVVETIPCEDCGLAMLVTATKCAGCGAEYEPVEDETQSAKPVTAPTTNGATGPAHAPSAKPKPTNGSAKPAVNVKAKEASAQESTEAQVVDTNCWSCGTELGGEINCPSCGIDQGDQIPFAFNESVCGWNLLGERWTSKLLTRRVI